MQNQPIPKLVEGLVSISGRENVLSEQSSMEDYRHDMADYEASPAVVVRPSSEEEVVEIVKLANLLGVPIVPRGAGSSLTGASLLNDAIVVDMRNMNKVLKVDTVNWYVQVQPGISLEDLNAELRRYGFFFPPDPASSYICTVGGAIAEGSGGLRCVKYGTMKDWVLSLRVVLPNGKSARFGEPLAKNRAGFDLVHLVVGSEGTLCIVTEAHLKIIPLPSRPTRRFMLNFDDWTSASRVIKELRSSKVMPHLFEFLDSENIRALNEKLEMNLPEAEATLIVDVEEGDVSTAKEIFERCGATRIRQAESDEEADMFYQVRAMAYLAVKATASAVQTEDVVVPIDMLGQYLAGVKKIAAKYGLRLPVNGHAGDGNVHPLILFDKEDPGSRDAAGEAFQELCREAIAMGGSVTGEHGVGVQKVKLLREQMEAHDGEEALRLMKEMKRVFDPKGIMNPGKYVEAA